MKGSQRNERCEKCGRKAKECRGHRTNNQLFSALVVFIGIVVCMAIVLMKTCGTTNKTVDLDKTIRAHIADRAHTHWMLNGDEGPDQSVAFIHEWTPKIQGFAEKYRDLGVAAAKIADLGPYAVGVYTLQGGFISLHEETARSQVIFYPATFFSKAPSICWYEREYHGIMVGAIEWPPIVLDGMLMHEGLHYAYDVEGRPSAKAELKSPEWVAEEVDAHILEAKVFDRASSGAYYKALDRIVGRHPEDASTKDVVSATKTSDLDALNVSVGCAPCTERLANILIKQHLLSIGMRQVSRRKLPLDEEMKVGSELYLWLWDY